MCVQKEPKYAWGCAPRPRRVGTPRPERLCLPGAGLDDACKEQRRICPLPVPLPRFGGGASCPSVHFPKPSAFIMLSAVLPLSANFPLSPPPQRRGQGWWFALPRSSAGAIKSAAGSLGAYLCAVRTMLCIVRIQHCKRLKGVRQGGISPLTLFCFLLQEQKEGLRGERYLPSLL